MSGDEPGSSLKGGDRVDDDEDLIEALSVTQRLLDSVSETLLKVAEVVANLARRVEELERRVEALSDSQRPDD
jgi:chaperonin cofactor prefoldin